MNTNAIRKTARALILTVPLAALVMVGATGCTTAPHSSSGSSAPQAKASASAHGAVTEVTRQPGTDSGYVGALKDVRITSCSAEAAPARFGGTVTNPTSTAQSYRIYVSLLAGGTTIGVRQVDVAHLGGHKTEKWSGTLPTGATGTTCVLRVERSS